MEKNGRYMKTTFDEFTNVSKNYETLKKEVIDFITKKSYLDFSQDDGNVLIFSTAENGSTSNEEASPIDLKEGKRIRLELVNEFKDKILSTKLEIVDEWIMLTVELPESPIKPEPVFSDKIKKYIKEIADKTGSYSGNSAEKYLTDFIVEKGLTDEQIKNLRDNLLSGYLWGKGITTRDIAGYVVNHDYSSSYPSYKYELIYKKNFKDNWKEVEPIECTYNKKPTILTNGIYDYFDNVVEIVGEVEDLYEVSKDNWRGYNDDNKSLFDQYKDAKRRYDFTIFIKKSDVKIPKGEELQDLKNKKKIYLEYQKGLENEEY